MYAYSDTVHYCTYVIIDWRLSVTQHVFIVASQNFTVLYCDYDSRQSTVSSYAVPVGYLMKVFSVFTDLSLTMIYHSRIMS